MKLLTPEQLAEIRERLNTDELHMFAIDPEDYFEFTNDLLDHITALEDQNAGLVAARGPLGANRSVPYFTGTPGGGDS